MRGESRQRFSAGALLGLALLFVATLGPATPTAAAGVARVTLTAEGQPVAALYWSGPKGSGKAPAVILLHMLGRSKEDWQSFGDILERSGYAAIALDLRGGGDAGKAKLVADARAAFAFLSKQPEVDAGRIGVVGASIGANGALLFAAEEPRVRCAALLSPGLDYHGVTTEAAMAQMKRPVLLVASEEDVYSAQSARRLERLAPGPKAIKIYSNAGHGTEMFKAGVGLDRELLTFFKTHL